MCLMEAFLGENITDLLSLKNYVDVENTFLS